MHLDEMGEVTEEEIQIRAEMAAEVFDGKEAPAGDDAPTETVDGDDTAPIIPDDPPEEPDAFSVQLDAINGKLSMLTTIENRLKQTESRVGSLQNEFQNAGKAAAAVADAPSKKEMKEAAESDESWDSLKTDFPEWADAIDSRLSKRLATNSTGTKDVASLRTDLDSVKGSVIAPQVFEQRLLGLIHPDWQATVKSPDYLAWIQTQPEDVKYRAANGTTADDGVATLNLFKASLTAPKTTPITSAAAKKKRLAQSVTPTSSHKTTPIKSEADMTEEELRKSIADEIWGT